MYRVVLQLIKRDIVRALNAHLQVPRNRGVTVDEALDEVNCGVFFIDVDKLFTGETMYLLDMHDRLGDSSHSLCVGLRLKVTQAVLLVVFLCLLLCGGSERRILQLGNSSVDDVLRNDFCSLCSFGRVILATGSLTEAVGRTEVHHLSGRGAGKIDEALREILTLVAEHTSVGQYFPEVVLYFFGLVAFLIVLVGQVGQRHTCAVLVVALNGDELTVARNHAGELMQHTE